MTRNARRFANIVPSQDQASQRCAAPEGFRLGKAPGKSNKPFGIAFPAQPIVAPPSTTIAWPVMNALAGEARNTAAPAISSGSPIRPSGVRAR